MISVKDFSTTFTTGLKYYTISSTISQTSIFMVNFVNGRWLDFRAFETAERGVDRLEGRRGRGGWWLKKFEIAV